MIVKKYGNRRLYDTERSRYITLDELAESIRAGSDVEVVDARTGEDLTQATLAQIILEGRGASRLLPVPLLVQLIRMGDDALAEFFQRYVTWALQVYLQLKQQARTLGALNPFAAMGLGAPPGFGSPWGRTPPPPPPEETEEGEGIGRDQVAELRRELEELREALGEVTGSKKKK